MDVQLSVDVVRPADLDEAQRTLWTRFRAQRDDLAPPRLRRSRSILSAGRNGNHSAR